MCEKLNYCARKIDPCIRNLVSELQAMGIKTVSSCCGHGVYPRSIVIKDEDGKYYEFFTGIPIFPEKKRHITYYKSIWNKEERKRYYYLDEVINLEIVTIIREQKA